MRVASSQQRDSAEGHLAVARLKVKVVPGASRTRVVGWLGDALKVRVSAPPEKGKANAAVAAVVAEALGLPAGSVAVVSGKSSPRKQLEIRGLGRQEIVRRLAVDNH